MSANVVLCSAPGPDGRICTLKRGHDGGHHAENRTWTNAEASARAFRDTSPETVLGVVLADRLPEGWQTEGVIVLVRAIDSDGYRRTTYLEGGDVMLWEATGMIDAAARSFGARLDALNECVEHGPPLDER